MAYPHIHSEFFGYGVELVSHTNSTINTHVGEQIKILLKANDNVLAISELARFKRATLCQRNPSTGLIEIMLCPPEEGTFELQIYAKLKDAAPPQYDILLEYNVIVGAKPDGDDKDVHYYPKTFGDFEQNDHYLYSPLSLFLPRGSRQHFKVYGGSCAVDIGVKCDGKRTKFVRSQQGNNVFEGDVQVGPGELTVYASYKGDNMLHSILTYNRALDKSAG